MKIPQDMAVGSIHEVKDGLLEITKYNHAKDIDVRFLNTGTEVKTRASHIRSGSTRDRMSPSVCGVGYIGVGKHLSSIKGRKTKAYVIWSHMIERCYLERVHKKQPTYSDCTVCEEWHNFQNFATWHEEHYPKDGESYDLDKDIKINGNRLYSPDFSMFVSHRDNVEKSRAKFYKMKSPNGDVIEIYNMRKFCLGKDINSSKMVAVHNGRRKSHLGWAKV